MRFSYLLLFSLFFFGCFQLCSPRPHKVNAYYGNWQYFNEYPVCKIPGDKIDKLFYNFLLTHAGTCQFVNNDIELVYPGPVDGVCGSPLQDASAPLKGNMYQFLKLKERFPHLKIIASIVGSYEMHEAMLTPAGRQNFVQGCIDMLQSYPSVFDGIDIDLEYPCLPHDPYCGGITPSADDKGAFAQFAQLFRQSMQPGQILTISMNLDFIKIDAFDFDILDSIIDEYHLMTYNIADGSWTSYSGHHTQPYGNPTDPILWRRDLHAYNSAKYLKSKNVDPSKILIAACFYGRGFRIQQRPYVGPFVPSYGVTGLGTYQDTPNIFYYWDIKANYWTDATYRFDEEAKAPFIYDESRNIYISFDDPKSVQAKVDIVHELGIGGIFAWELGMDRSGELLDTMNNHPTCLANNNCRCPSTEIPGNIPLSSTPQFIILGFDGSIYNRDFATVEKFGFVLNNDAIKDSLGCTPRPTGYFTGRWGDYTMVNYINSIGSAAMYSYTLDESFATTDTSASVWDQELETLSKDFQFLAQTTPVGSRAPYYVTNDAYYQELVDMGIKFDNSMMWNDKTGKTFYWPFTFDCFDVIPSKMCNLLGHCPSKSYKGLWEFVTHNFDYDNDLNFADFAVDETNYASLLQKFKDNFQDSYNLNKAPRAINLRWNYFSNGWFESVNTLKKNFIVEFLTWITTTHNDIVFATESQVIDWIKNPVPLNQLSGSIGFTCPSRTITPETACANGLQKRCVYNNYDAINVCGSLCPNVKPDLGVTWNLVADSAPWSASARLVIAQSDIWGSDSDPWAKGFCGNVFASNPDPVKTAYDFVLTVRTCSNTGFNIGPYGQPSWKIMDSFGPDNTGFRMKPSGGFSLPPMSGETWIGGFCMNINSMNKADPSLFAIGVDLYSASLNCQPDNCPVTCGGEKCLSNWVQGSPQACDQVACHLTSC